MPSYCNTTTDLYRVYPRLEDFKEWKTLRGWVVYSGSVYKLGNVGYGEVLNENGLQITKVASIALVNGAGKYFYDSATDILYLQATSGLPTASTNIYKWGTDWVTLKSWAVQQASETLDGLLDPRFPIPLPENPYGSSDRPYDGAIIQITSLLAASLIAGRNDPPLVNSAGEPQNVAARLQQNAQALIDKLNAAEIKLAWEQTADEIGGWNIRAMTGNTSVGMFQLRGEFTEEDDALWMVKITKIGAIGTSEYKLSTDNGTTYGDAIVTSAGWAELSEDIDVRFNARGSATPFILNDSWQIELTASSRSMSRPRVGNINMVG